ncbi:MAG: hypothetical protein H6822_25540 [Planctomycetaceae bacterium]|nr:hypothetical protein [Planctomycetaceae bacterium]
MASRKTESLRTFELHLLSITECRYNEAFFPAATHPTFMNHRVHNSPNLIYSVGTQIVALKQLQASWMPLTFQLAEIHLISREHSPDDAFQVIQTIALGS